MIVPAAALHALTTRNWPRLMHGCKANIDPVINSPKFGNSVLIITFDESVTTDFTNGGGQVATVLVGPHVKTGFRSSTMYQHQSLLHTMLQLLNVNDMPGASAVAASMGEFFQ